MIAVICDENEGIIFGLMFNINVIYNLKCKIHRVSRKKYCVGVSAGVEISEFMVSCCMWHFISWKCPDVKGAENGGRPGTHRTLSSGYPASLTHNTILVLVIVFLCVFLPTNWCKRRVLHKLWHLFQTEASALLTFLQ